MLKIEPRVTGDDSGSAFSVRYQQGYHSHFGALTQARWVYLNASGIGERLHLGIPSTVLEIGFGLGLNTLVTADCATRASCTLHYHAIENDMVSAVQFGQLGYGQWLSDARLVDRLLQGLASSCRHQDMYGCVSNALERETAFAAEHHITLSPYAELKLIHADATNVALDAQVYDAVYLDPFSPDVNPECWSIGFLAGIYRALKTGGVLTTYSVKGNVRRALEAVGFDVGKCPGPPGKREMLRAIRLHL